MVSLKSTFFYSTFVFSMCLVNLDAVKLDQNAANNSLAITNDGIAKITPVLAAVNAALAVVVGSKNKTLEAIPEAELLPSDIEDTQLRAVLDQTVKLGAGAAAEAFEVKGYSVKSDVEDRVSRYDDAVGKAGAVRALYNGLVKQGTPALKGMRQSLYDLLVSLGVTGLTQKEV